MNELNEAKVPIEHAIEDLTVNQKLVNGTQLLLIYYFIIIIFFIVDTVLTYKTHIKHELIKETDNKVKWALARVYISYRKFGLITINAIIWAVCIAIIIYNVGFEFSLLFTITLSFIIYTVIMKLILRIFINKESYDDDSTVRFINTICYILLGNFFCYYMHFISSPDLKISMAGLTLALLFCFYIMLHAIFNPKILQKNANSYMIYSEAYGIIKGMLAVLLCMIATLYLMVFCCYQTNHGFYTSTDGSVDIWDLFYYLIISFTTIGYGDIVPVRLDGMFYSRYTAIVIGLSSMFTTACFVAAVISTANSLAKTTRDRYKEYDDKGKVSKPFEISEDKIRQIINETISSYKKRN